MGDKIKILYIDDYELDRELVKDALEKEHGGFELTQASCRQEFESLLKTQAFDVVLSDFNIAGFDGLQVLHAVREYDPQIPVIIVTGTGSEEIAAMALKQGASDYVIKRPKHIQRLPQTIFAAIENKTLRDQHRKVEAALKESEERFRNIAENSLAGIYIIQDGIFIYVNPKFAEIFGYAVAECLDNMHFAQLVYPQDLDTVREQIRKRISGECQSVQYAFRGITKDGKTVHVEIFGSSFLLSGKPVATGTMIDITERKQAEAEQAKLEGQLQQAQKMESVGRLAGGVAHDYNNMLSIIIGYAELAMGKIPPADPLYTDLAEILSAANRSADITRQLLAFARKQTIAPKVLDLNDTIESMLKMIRRLVGEDIDLAWLPGTEVWPVKIDPGQVDQVLANLCVNARDAISDVGKITIETGKVIFDDAYCADHAGFVPGEFVLLAVSDDGCGMTPETLDNIFEPFFTTKDVGMGTGLGLATVYGIVKQNKGFINVYSEPEKGTSFRIYLPRHETDAEQIRKKAPVVPDTRGSETILLVEDEPAILKMTTKMLELLGYTLLGANTPSEAIRLASEHSGEIHLLMTDVVMPEMNGRDLARKLLALYPNLKRLFMSGYTANVIAHHGVLDEGVHFIQKPFARQELASKVRKALSETI